MLKWRLCIGSQRPFYRAKRAAIRTGNAGWNIANASSLGDSLATELDMLETSTGLVFDDAEYRLYLFKTAGAGRDGTDLQSCLCHGAVLMPSEAYP
jgi:hypothetical protein